MKVFIILPSVGPEDQGGGISEGITSYQKNFKYELKPTSMQQTFGRKKKSRIKLRRKYVILSYYFVVY